MNATSPTEADLEKIEAAYQRLKPLRELEADVRGWKVQDWRGFLVAVLVTVCYGFIAAVGSSQNFVVYLGGVVTLLSWLGYFNTIESKRISLVTASLRGIADELHELRKKQP